MINRMIWNFGRISLFCCLLAVCLENSAQSKHEKWTIRALEYNVENLFDCQHDSLKQDFEFLPDGDYHWTPSKYWRKLNAVARGIVLASSQNGTFLPPDLIGLCEVENDSVIHSLVHRSLLRGAGYEYVMTNSPDERGVDVALLYQPVSFRLISHYGLRVDPIEDMRPTRDILYVKGEVLASSDTADVATLPLHVFVVHAPSRRGGEQTSRPFRLAVMQRMLQSVDSLRATDANARIIVMGDFNDYAGDASLKVLSSAGFTDVSAAPYITKDNKVKGTYKYQGEWGSLDHILISEPLMSNFSRSFITYDPEMLEDDEKYGGVKPYRFFRGPIVNGGYSDHLPLFLELNM